MFKNSACLIRLAYSESFLLSHVIISSFPYYYAEATLYYYFIIIIKRGRQCKAEREVYTPYQSEDPSPKVYRLGGETDSAI